jgi:hypothetical protein
MSDVANTFVKMKPELKETYSDTKKKSFKKIKDKVKKCKCSDKCSCKK